MEIRGLVTLLILLKKLPIIPKSFTLSPYDLMWCVVSASPGLGVYQFSPVAQSCLTLWDPTHCSSPGFPVHHQLPKLLKLMSIKSMMPSNHLILCHPLLFPPSIFPSIRVFSNESVLWIRGPKYWSFIFSISTSHEYSGLISFRIDWLGLLAVQGSIYDW